MARQGNFVTLPGGNVNWTAGIADAVFKYGALKGEQAREARSLQEREADRKLQRERLALEDSRFEEEQAFKRRERERAKKGRKAVADFASTYDRSELNRELLRNDPNLRQLTTRKQLQNQENLARNVLIDVWKSQGRDLITSDVPTGVDAINALQTEYANFRKNGGSERLSGIFDNYAQEMADLSQKTENFVLSEAPIYRGARQRAIFQDLLRKGVDERTASGIARDFTEGDLTRDAAERSALANARLQQQAAEKAATTAYRFASLQQKEKQAGFRKLDKQVSNTDVYSTVSKVDPGIFDEATLTTYVNTALKDKKMSPVYVNEAVKRAISIDPMLFGLFTTTDVNVKDEQAFLSLVNTVKAEQEAGKVLNKDLLDKIMAEAPAAKDATTAAREAFFGGIAQLSPDLTRLPNSRPPDLTGNTASKETIENADNTEIVQANREQGVPVVSPADVLTPVETNSRRREIITPERQTKIDTRNADATLTRHFKERYGNFLGTGIEDKKGEPREFSTIFVYPYDEKGKPKSWRAIADDAKGRTNWSDTLTSNAEIAELDGRPTEQAAYINKVNALIASDLRLGTDLLAAKGNIGDFTNLLAHQLTGLVNERRYSSLDPRNLNRERALAASIDNTAQRDRLLSRIDDFIQERTGISDLGDAFSTQITRSPTSATLASVPAAIALEAAAVPAAGLALTRGVPAAAGALSRGTSAVASSVPGAARTVLNRGASIVTPAATTAANRGFSALMSRLPREGRVAIQATLQRLRTFASNVRGRTQLPRRLNEVVDLPPSAESYVPTSVLRGNSTAQSRRGLTEQLDLF